MPSRFVDVPLGQSLTSVGRFSVLFCSVPLKLVRRNDAVNSRRSNGQTTGGRSPAIRAKRREAWKQRQLQLSTWNHEERQQQQQQQQQRLLIEKDRRDADKLKNYAARHHQKALAQLIEL